MQREYSGYKYTVSNTYSLRGILPNACCIFIFLTTQTIYIFKNYHIIIPIRSLSILYIYYLCQREKKSFLSLSIFQKIGIFQSKIQISNKIVSFAVNFYRIDDNLIHETDIKANGVLYLLLSLLSAARTPYSLFVSLPQQRECTDILCRGKKCTQLACLFF